MSSRRSWIVLALAGVALLGGAYAYWSAQMPVRPPAAGNEPGLDWLPADAVAVAGVHVNELRQQGWLMELLEQAAPTGQESEYHEFVAATGFDYARDLDHTWLAVLPGRPGSPASPEGGPTAAGGELVGVVQGRFEPQKIAAYARLQGARELMRGRRAIYHLAAGESGRQFALTFLDPEHLAFAQSLAGLEHVLACADRRVAAVSADPDRRAALEMFSAGMHVWAVAEDASRWTPPGLDRYPDIAAQLRRLAAALRASPEGIELAAEAATREPEQAEAVKLVLETYGAVGQMLLGRRDDPTSRALREALTGARLSRQQNWLRLEAKLSRAAVAALLAGEALPGQPAGNQP